jgi:TonB family protein
VPRHPGVVVSAAHRERVDADHAPAELPDGFEAVADLEGVGQAEGVGPVEREVVKTPPSTVGRGARVTKPEYPPASRRAGEEGTVTLRAFVDENGRCSQIEVVKSSGFPKLDEAAVNEVKRNWRFVPGKEDGKPVSMWHTFAVTFRLTD